MRDRTAVALLVTGILAAAVLAFGALGFFEAFAGSPTPAASSSAPPAPGAPRPRPAFGNFERILPRQGAGYYREYTVPTPGEAGRAARRIVTGAAGGKYYTADHYDSFKFIAEGS